MEKVVCNICGTVFPENAENCPVCGCSRDFLMEDIEDALLMGESADRGGSRKKNREIFDFDEVNQERTARRAPDDEDDFEEDEEYDEEPRTNVALVVILVILIVLLLLAAGFFYVRFIMPNRQDVSANTTAAAVVETETAELTEPVGIPCTNLMIDGGKMELREGGMKLLNVHVYPEDTTDTITYVSADESVATVSGDGTVTAVGEGTTVITITCGQQQINCNITVDYDAVDDAVAEGTIPPVTVNAEGDDSADPTAETQVTGETETADTTEPVESTASAAELKLKKTDISIFSNYVSVELEMDCDINPEDVDWFTMDSTVAIVHDGVVTSTGSGLTRIYGEYNGQQVECIVRCVF